MAVLRTDKSGSSAWIVLDWPANGTLILPGTEMATWFFPDGSRAVWTPFVVGDRPAALWNLETGVLTATIPLRPVQDPDVVVVEFDRWIPVSRRDEFEMHDGRADLSWTAAKPTAMFFTRQPVDASATAELRLRRPFAQIARRPHVQTPDGGFAFRIAS